MKKALLAVLVVVAFTGVLFAADAVATGDVAKFDWNNLWKGALMGAVASVIGWFKSKDFGKEKFDFELLLATAVCGLIAGIIAAWQNKSIDTVNAWLVSCGGAMFIEAIVKALWRRLFHKAVPVTATPTK